MHTQPQPLSQLLLGQPRTVCLVLLRAMLLLLQRASTLAVNSEPTSSTAAQLHSHCSQPRCHAVRRAPPVILSCRLHRCSPVHCITPGPVQHPSSHALSQSAAYLRGMKREPVVEPRPARPCRTGLYVMLNSPR